MSDDLEKRIIENLFGRVLDMMKADQIERGFASIAGPLHQLVRAIDDLARRPSGNANIEQRLDRIESLLQTRPIQIDLEGPPLDIPPPTKAKRSKPERLPEPVNVYNQEEETQLGTETDTDTDTDTEGRLGDHPWCRGSLSEKKALQILHALPFGVQLGRKDICEKMGSVQISSTVWQQAIRLLLESKYIDREGERSRARYLLTERGLNFRDNPPD